MFSEKSAVCVAEQLYTLAKKKGDVTLTKLIKLLYIAHGCKLSIENAPLFADKVEAWRHGAVIPSVYYALKHHKGNVISVNTSNVIINEKNKELFYFVIDNWGDLSDKVLSELTRLNETPWYIAWHEKGGKNSIALEISNEDIKEYYNNFFSKKC